MLRTYKTYVEEKKCMQVLVGKPEGKRQLRRPRHRWEGNVVTDLREVEWESVDWIYMAQG